jgi:hypothetical protein
LAAGRDTKGTAEVFSGSRSAGMRCQNQQCQVADFVGHRETTLFRWRALRNPGWIYAAFPKWERGGCAIPDSAALHPGYVSISFSRRQGNAVNDLLGQLHANEERFWVQVVFARLVYDAQLIVFVGIRITNYLVQLAPLQRGFIAGVFGANYKVMFSHEFQST